MVSELDWAIQAARGAHLLLSSVLADPVFQEFVQRVADVVHQLVGAIAKSQSALFSVAKTASERLNKS